MATVPFRPACEIPIFFATTEGHTHRIAQRLAATLRELGFASCPIDVAGREAGEFDWSQARAAIVGASLHAGRHQREATAFVTAHAEQLSAVPSAFYSVSLSAASARVEEVAAARALAEGFGPPLGWRPATVRCIAGCLAYSKYGFIKRWMMVRIARKEGGPTDTSRDHNLTNWREVGELAKDVARLAREPAAKAS